MTSQLNVYIFLSLTRHYYLESISSTFYARIFLTKIGAKNSKPKSKYKKAVQRLSYKKGTRKMLVKLTPDSSSTCAIERLVGLSTLEARFSSLSLAPPHKLTRTFPSIVLVLSKP